MDHDGKVTVTVRKNRRGPDGITTVLTRTFDTALARFVAAGAHPDDVQLLRNSTFEKASWAQMGRNQETWSALSEIADDPAVRSVHDLIAWAIVSLYAPATLAQVQDWEEAGIAYGWLHHAAGFTVEEVLAAERKDPDADRIDTSKALAALRGSVFPPMLRGPGLWSTPWS